MPSRPLRTASAFGGIIQFGDFIPVDDIPPGADVFGTLVLVLEVVRVFPYIESQNGDVSLQIWRILIGRAEHLEDALVI